MERRAGRPRVRGQAAPGWRNERPEGTTIATRTPSHTASGETSHALATDLLARGVRLPEIAQVLRQRDLATTAVYAKVDYAVLRELALPWPAAAQ